MSIIAMEYPGYGVYQSDPTEERILQDAESVLDFAVEELGVEHRDIIVVGRSLGSGPAVHLASTNRVMGLVLVSAFTSIGDVVKDKFSSIVSLIVKQRFDNLAKIGLVKSPVHFVHGLKDTLVTIQHCYKLKGRLEITEKKLGAPAHSI